VAGLTDDQSYSFVRLLFLICTANSRSSAASCAVHVPLASTTVVSKGLAPGARHRHRLPNSLLLGTPIAGKPSSADDTRPQLLMLSERFFMLCLRDQPLRITP
jgi:hypothetical protein